MWVVAEVELHPPVSFEAHSKGAGGRARCVADRSHGDANLGAPNVEGEGFNLGPMRTVVLANNRLGARVVRFLADRGDLVGAVLHPVERRKGIDDVMDIGSPVWTWPDGLEEARSLNPDCLLSVLFGYVLPGLWLEVPSWGAVNLHPGFLPWNRGSAPNVWPLVDGSPAGTTLHVMTTGLDRGPILMQRRVGVRPEDTAESLYRRLEEASFAMLTEGWTFLADMAPTEQEGEGSFHRMADLAKLDPTTDSELAVIDRLRARTFPPYGAEFERQGRRYRVRVVIDPLD